MLLQPRDSAIRSGDRALNSAARANLIRGIRTAKAEYKRRIEEHAQQGVQTITNYKGCAVTPRDSDAGLAEDLTQNKLQPGLKREVQKEIMEQIQALSSKFMREERTQFSTREVLPNPNTQRTDYNTAASPTLMARQWSSDTVTAVYQWDVQGRPICRSCGAAGHVQCQCAYR